MRILLNGQEMTIEKEVALQEAALKHAHDWWHMPLSHHTHDFVQFTHDCLHGIGQSALHVIYHYNW